MDGDQHQQLPDWQRLGFSNKREWSEAYVESVDWQEINKILFNLEIGDHLSAQKMIDILVRDRKNGSGAAGTVLLKLELLGLIDSPSEATLIPLNPMEMRDVRKSIDANLGLFKEDDSYHEWEAVRKILSGMRLDRETAINAIHFYQEQWKNGHTRSGVILTKLQAVGLIDELRDPEVNIVNEEFIVLHENKIDRFLNHQSPTVD